MLSKGQMVFCGIIGIMDYLFIDGLKVKAQLGIYTWEQRIAQTVLIDVKMQVAPNQAAQNNDITMTLNYQQVVEYIRAFFTDEVFGIIENIAERLATILLEKFAINWLRLRIAKPNIFADVDAVGITIERGEQQ